MSPDPGRRRALAVGALSLYALVGLLAWIARDVGMLPGERWLTAHAFGKVRNVYAVQATYSLANLGSPLLVVATVAVVCWFATTQCGPRWGVLVTLTPIAGGIAGLLKRLVGPTEIDRVYGLLSGSSGSLPSGHCAYVTSLFTLVAAMGWSAGRRDVAVAALIPVVAIGPALVTKAAHFPSDVVAGYALGVAWTLTLIGVAAPPPLRRPRSAG